MVGDTLHYVRPAGIAKKHFADGASYKGPKGYDCMAQVISENLDGTANLLVHFDPARDAKSTELIRNVAVTSEWRPGTAHPRDVADPVYAPPAPPSDPEEDGEE